jgi:uncharacterized membrane protein YidH (DUF202 family)
MQGGAARESGVSLAIGVAFMAMGIFIALVSTVRYRTTMRRLDADQFKPAGPIVVIIGVMAALFGVVLAIYLIFTAQKI